MLIVPVGENNYRNFKRYSLIRLRVVFQNVVVNVNVVRLASFFFFFFFIKRLATCLFRTLLG